MAYDFSDLLRRARLDAGLSQEALAERAGVSAVAISGYERGLPSSPRAATIASLADALRLSDETRAEFLKTAASRRPAGGQPSIEAAHNLPWQPTSFVGRRREIEVISALLEPRSLVTITGSGGIGKTRIAVELAARLARSCESIWFVDLAPLTDAALVLGKIASSLDIHVPDRDNLLAAIVATIETHASILILDNCEHVIPVLRSPVEAILQECSEIKILATSRERIGVAGERAYRLSTLPTPTETIRTTAEGRSYDAIELFAERAATAQHSFVLLDEHVEAAADICRRLNGIAFAIELAAARLPYIGISALRTQLAKNFHVIAGARHDLPVRQQTLNATISWSYDLLDELERLLFQRLAVFVGGWTLDAAQCVCADNRVLNEDSVLDTLFALAEKSLVVIDLDAATPRYSFYESTRAFALERLVRSGEGSDLSRRHAQWMAAFADRAYDLHVVAPRWQWEVTAAPEIDNALAALEWALGPDGDGALGARITSGLRGLWQYPGLAAYGRKYINTALGLVNDREHPQVTARLLLAQNRFLHGSESLEVLKRAISLLEQVDDRLTLVRCYSSLSHSLSRTGKDAEAEQMSDTALHLLREGGLARSLSYAAIQADRGLMFRRQNRFDEAKAAIVEALSLANALEDHWRTPYYQSSLAEIEFDAGDIRAAITLAQEALQRARRIEGTQQQSYLLCNLACYQLVSGDSENAAKLAREALALARGSDSNVVQLSVQHLATVAAIQGRASHAARLLGYVDAWYSRINSSRGPTEQKGYAVLMTSLSEQLSEGDIAAFAAQGASLSEEAIIEDALCV